MMLTALEKVMYKAGKRKTKEGADDLLVTPEKIFNSVQIKPLVLSMKYRTADLHLSLQKSTPLSLV